MARVDLGVCLFQNSVHDPATMGSLLCPVAGLRLPLPNRPDFEPEDTGTDQENLERPFLQVGLALGLDPKQ